MSDKKRLRVVMKNIRRVKVWQLLIVLVLMLFVSATLLRLNNIGMVERRTVVLDADSKGDDKASREALSELQYYVSKHMNTDMGRGVFLQGAYNRAFQKASQEAANDNNQNGNIYVKAQEVCAPQFASYSYAYVQCVVNELGKYSSSSELVSAIQVPTEIYIHDFASPFWSPDLAGWSIVICIAILTMIIARLIGVVILKTIIKKRGESL